MPVYSAFLRAVNVSGHGIIKMTELKQLFEKAGFKNVTTYIQSGNVIFSFPGRNIFIIRDKIEAALGNFFEKEVNAFIRTPAEIERILQNNPFDVSTIKKESPVYVALLNELPDEYSAEAVEAFSNETDTIITAGKEIYCMVHKSAGKSLFSTNWLEKKLNLPVTARNISTIIKMNELIKN